MNNMDNTPVMSAYPDEQAKLDAALEEEVKVWKKIRQVLDESDYTIKLSLVDGLPDMSLVKK
jgi:hypothetical protein